MFWGCLCKILFSFFGAKIWHATMYVMQTNNFVSMSFQWVCNVENDFKLRQPHDYWFNYRSFVVINWCINFKVLFFLILEMPKNMTKTIQETPKFLPWFSMNHLKLANSIPDPWLFWWECCFKYSSWKSKRLGK